jgi:hypothetical protein
MAKHIKVTRSSNFKVKAAQVYMSKNPLHEDIHARNVENDPRLTRVDGGRVRPVFYGDDLIPRFEPR